MLGSATVQGEQEALDDWQLSEGTATIGGAMAPQEMLAVHSFLSLSQTRAEDAICGI